MNKKLSTREILFSEDLPLGSVVSLREGSLNRAIFDADDLFIVVDIKRSGDFTSGTLAYCLLSTSSKFPILWWGWGTIQHVYEFLE